jgi:dUTP pyrophosphatase
MFFNNRILFSKVKPDAIIPSKREEDGGYDLYSCFEEDSIRFKPGEIKLVPTGIASAFSKKRRIVFQERGNTGIIGLKVNAGLIDSGYRDEWFVCLNNTSNSTIYIDKSVNKITKEYEGKVVRYPYTKAICQFKIQRVYKDRIKEVPYEKLKQIKSERGMGKIGSSNK